MVKFFECFDKLIYAKIFKNNKMADKNDDNKWDDDDDFDSEDGDFGIE